MAAFSRQSRARLASCHPDLERLFLAVVAHFDCSVLIGHRDEAAQEEAYRTGHSTKRWPASRHNAVPSLAADVAPYPIDWADRERMHLFAGYVMGVAAQMGVGIRWGGDWDRDTQVRDNRFDDLVHFELVN